MTEEKPALKHSFHEDASCGACDGPLETCRDAVCMTCAPEHMANVYAASMAPAEPAKCEHVCCLDPCCDHEECACEGARATKVEAAEPAKPCAESHVRCRLGNECHVGVFWKDSRDAFRALAEENGQRAEKAALDAVTQRNAYEIERERAEKAEAELDEANRTIQQKDRAGDSLYKALEDCGAERDAALALLKRVPQADAALFADVGTFLAGLKP